MSTKQDINPVINSAPIQRQIQLNHGLPTLYIDNVSIHPRNDDMYFLRFTANLPDYIAEQSRLLVDKKNFEKILDALCQISNHYPVKSEKPKI
jgi:hypothetical protein